MKDHISAEDIIRKNRKFTPQETTKNSYGTVFPNYIEKEYKGEHPLGAPHIEDGSDDESDDDSFEEELIAKGGCAGCEFYHEYVNPLGYKSMCFDSCGLLGKQFTYLTVYYNNRLFPLFTLGKHALEKAIPVECPKLHGRGVELSTIYRNYHPETWEVDQEYSLGKGLYGQRFIGKITAEANLTYAKLLDVSVNTKTVRCVVSYGGYYFVDKLRVLKWYTRSPDQDDYVEITKDGLFFYSRHKDDRVSDLYDVWVIYCIDKPGQLIR